jgi:hypothetical protein
MQGSALLWTALDRGQVACGIADCGTRRAVRPRALGEADTTPLAGWAEYVRPRRRCSEQ